MRNVCDVVIGAEGEDDGFESSVGNGLILARTFFDGYCHPGQLSVVQEEALVGQGCDKEVLVDELDDVLDDGASGDGSLVVAVVMQKAVLEDMLERFAL